MLESGLNGSHSIYGEYTLNISNVKKIKVNGVNSEHTQESTTLEPDKETQNSGHKISLLTVVTCALLPQTVYKRTLSVTLHSWRKKTTTNKLVLYLIQAVTDQRHTAVQRFVYSELAGWLVC